MRAERGAVILIDEDLESARVLAGPMDTNSGHGRRSVQEQERAEVRSRTTALPRSHPIGLAAAAKVRGDVEEIRVADRHVDVTDPFVR